MPVQVQTPQMFTNNDQTSLADATKLTEQSRRSRLQDISDALAAEANSRAATTAVGVDQAIRGSYANALQPAAPSNLSQDQTGGGAPSVTDGQTQVQSIPQTRDQVKPSSSPIGSMQISSSAIPPMQAAPVTPVSAAQLNAPTPPMSKSSIPTPPPSTAFTQQGSSVTQTMPSGQQVTASPSPAPQPSATPFDSPEFQNNLAAHLASVPGAGQELMKIKASRDATIGTVMQMITNGHTDEARFTAQRNGLNIPEQFYQNSDLAAGMNYGQKAYPEDPDKGQVFFQAYVQTPGNVDQKVQAGMAAAGAPTSFAQKELAKAVALGRGNYQTPGGGLVNVNPFTHQATPYTDASTGAPVQVKAGYGIRPTAGSQPKFQNVGGSLVYTDPNTGTARVVVPKNADPTTAITGIMNHIMSSGINVNPQDAKSQAVQIYNELKATTGGSAVRSQTPSGAAPAPLNLTPAMDTYENPYGGQQPAMVSVMGPSGDRLKILPADLPAAMKEGYQQVQ